MNGSNLVRSFAAAILGMPRQTLESKLKKLGIVPGEAFDPAKLDPAVVDALRMQDRPERARLMHHAVAAGQRAQGQTHHDQGDLAEHTHRIRHARAVDDAAEHVAAEVVARSARRVAELLDDVLAARTSKPRCWRTTP